MKRHTTDTFFTLSLLLVFALFTFMLTALGSSVYKNTVAHMDENFTSRTAISYIAEQVRQHDTDGGIDFVDLDSTRALAFYDKIEGSDYITYVYYQDGALKELFFPADRIPETDLGTTLVKLDNFQFSYDSVSQLLNVSAAQDNITLHLEVAL